LENGRLVYEIELHYPGHAELECVVDARTGEVLNGRPHDAQADRPAQNEPDQPTTDPAAEPAQSASPAPAGPISAENAKAAVLAHAGVAAADVSRWKCELDRDDGRLIYEVEFQVGRWEYQYEIDAYTGRILEWEKEYDD